MRSALVMVSLLFAAAAFGHAPPGPIVYIDDDFLPDTSMNGWTTYGSPTITNPEGNGFSLWTPCYYREDEQVGIAGVQVGGGTGGGWGMWKQFMDEEIPGETKYIQVVLRMLTCDWGWALTPDALTVRVGVDLDGGTDPAGVDIWTDPYWGEWTTLTIELPCQQGLETVFIDVQGWNNGYSQLLVDFVHVWQTPEPATLGLLGLSGLGLLLRKRR